MSNENYPAHSPAVAPEKPPAVAPVVPLETRKHPAVWAREKGLLKLLGNSAIDWREPPRHFLAAKMHQRWPDQKLAPKYSITESEFDAAIASVAKV